MRYVTFKQIKDNEQVRFYLQSADDSFAAIGYKEHGFRHALTSAEISGNILSSLGYSHTEVELSKIAAYLHDIGNALGQNDHPQTGAVLALNLLRKLGMPYNDIFKITIAIGSHEDRDIDPPNNICSAVILGDKSDVSRLRVRKTDFSNFDMHDRVNFAVTESKLKVDKENRTIGLYLAVDTKICSVMEYFEIFTSRMKFCKRAANFLGCNFEFYINSDKML